MLSEGQIKNLMNEVKLIVATMSTSNTSMEKRKQTMATVKKMKLLIVNSRRINQNKEPFNTYEDVEMFYTNEENIAGILEEYEGIYISQ